VHSNTDFAGLRELKAMRNLGLIGGLGPVQRGDRIAMAQYFARLIERLARGGAELAAISAVRPHICIRELQKISPLPLVNIIEEVGAEIRSHGFTRVALFGTRFVVESRMFGMLEGIEVLASFPGDVFVRISKRLLGWT
jgi:hypothetical protein